MSSWGGLRTARGRALLVAVAVLGANLAAASTAGAYIYWADYGAGLGGSGSTINRADIDGHAQKNGFISTSGSPTWSPGPIASDGTHLYWGSTSSGPSAIGRANVDGSGVNPTFIPPASVGTEAFGIAVTSSYIFWTDGTRYIGRANLDGTGASPHFIDMGSNHAPYGIAVSASTLYVGMQGQVVTLPASASANPTVTTFATLMNGNTFPFALSISNGYAYWAEVNLGAGGSTIARHSLIGGEFEESYIPSLQDPTGVATDGSWVYWVDHGTGMIGKALDNGSTAAAVQTNFLSDSGGPWGIAVDALIDPTTTSVSCTPSTVAAGDPSVCTATVHDSASSEAPGGTVTFSGSASTFFPGGNTCTLGAIPGGGGSSCTVGAQSSANGQQSVTGSYPGDVAHSPSSGSGQYCVGDSTLCGGGSGGGGSGGGGSGGGGSGGGTSGGGGAGGGGGSGPHPVCKVPRLKGKTLAKARKLLTAAHCRLGKVTRPHLRRGRHPALVVGGQSPGTGRTMPGGAKVSLRLVARRRSRHG